MVDGAAGLGPRERDGRLRRGSHREVPGAVQFCGQHADGAETTSTEGPDPLAFGAPALWFLAAHDLFDQDLSCHG